MSENYFLLGGGPSPGCSTGPGGCNLLTIGIYFLNCSSDKEILTLLSLSFIKFSNASLTLGLYGGGLSSLSLSAFYMMR